jgi:hypothetical protein
MASIERVMLAMINANPRRQFDFVQSQLTKRIRAKRRAWQKPFTLSSDSAFQNKVANSSFRLPKPDSPEGICRTYLMRWVGARGRNLVGVKFAFRDSVQHPEFLDEDGIGEEFRDVVLIADRLDVHNGFPVCAFRQIAPKKSFFPLRNIVHDILNDFERFLLLARVGMMTFTMNTVASGMNWNSAL